MDILFSTIRNKTIIKTTRNTVEGYQKEQLDQSWSPDQQTDRQVSWVQRQTGRRTAGGGGVGVAWRLPWDRSANSAPAKFSALIKQPSRTSHRRHESGEPETLLSVSQLSLLALFATCADHAHTNSPK